MISPHRRIVWLVRAFKLIVIAAVLWGVYRALRGSFDELREHTFELNYAWLLVAAAVYLVSLLPSGCYWLSILDSLGQRSTWLRGLRAYYIGHLGKYVPGKAMVVILRTGLVRGRGVRASVAAVSVFLETLTMMASGAFLAGLMILIQYRQHLWLAALAGVLTIAAGLPTLPPIFRRLVRWMPKRMLPDADQLPLERINFRLLATGWLATSVGWVLMGISLGATMRAMDIAGADILRLLPLYIACVSLAVVAGFLSLIPGGAGVRELILGVLIAQQFGQTAAVLTAVMLRLVWLGSEVVISSVLYVVGRSMDLRVREEQA
ncbi:MAG: lysylphosphatidylglycerol synthase domain-containing protein [Pirellulales bacterium]